LTPQLANRWHCRANLKKISPNGSWTRRVCADLQSGQWLVRAIENYRSESKTRLKATDARNLSKVALRTQNNVAQTQDELLKWNKNLNLGLHTEHWRILDKQPETTGQRPILLIEWDSLSAIKRTGYMIFTGLSEGTIKGLKEAQPQKEGVVLNTASSILVSEGEGDDTPTPSDYQRGSAVTEEEIPLSIKSTSAEHRTPSKGTWSDKRGAKEKWMQTDPSPSEKKE
jgi:hypothetical protein